MRNLTRNERIQRWLWLLFSFSGRIGRGPFWTFQALFLATVIALITLDQVFVQLWIPFLFPINPFFLLLLWANLAVDVKRWHDLDRSGWWVLFTLVPIIGPIWVLIQLGLAEGTPGENRFGPPPIPPPTAGG